MGCWFQYSKNAAYQMYSAALCEEQSVFFNSSMKYSSQMAGSDGTGDHWLRHWRYQTLCIRFRRRSVRSWPGAPFFFDDGVASDVSTYLRTAGQHYCRWLVLLRAFPLFAAIQRLVTLVHSKERFQERMLSLFFSMFYFSINAGSMISTFISPIFRCELC